MHPYKNPLKKNLLILSGGIEAIEGIKVAKKMGLRTIVCDGSKLEIFMIPLKLKT